MAGLSVTGQTKVSTLQEGFLKEFGLTLRIYDGRAFADLNETLAQVRKKKGSGKDLSVAKNMKVGNLEDKFKEEFGLKVQVAGSDDSYLCDNNLTLKAAQEEDEKKLARKERKAARQGEASDDWNQPKITEQNLIGQESYKFRVLETTFQADVDVKLLADQDWEFNSDVCDNPSKFQQYFMDKYGFDDNSDEDSYDLLFAYSYKERETNKWKLIILDQNHEEFLNDEVDAKEGLENELYDKIMPGENNFDGRSAIWNKALLFSVDREELYDESDYFYFDECPREEGDEHYICNKIEHEIHDMEEGNVFLVESTDAYFSSDSIGGVSIKTIFETMFSTSEYKPVTIDLLEEPLAGKMLDREWPFDRIFLSDSSDATRGKNE